MTTAKPSLAARWGRGVATPTEPEPGHLLFLISDTGAGHRASAQAVARHLSRQWGERFQVHMLEPFKDASPGVAEGIVSLYSPMARYTPPLWGGVYHATNSRLAVRALRSSLFHLVYAGVEDVIRVMRPSAIVCFHHVVSHAAVRGVRRLGLDIPVMTVITDLVDVHALWVCEGVDAVVTATPRALDAVRRRGVPAERCHDLGLPIDASFLGPVPDPGQRAELRLRLGLAPERFTVLLAGGGEGMGHLPAKAEALLNAGVDMQVVAICGRNAAARTRIEQLAARHEGDVHVRGFVPNMAEWMRCADLLITKAGPGTVAEACATEVPLLLTSYVHGQERGNVPYVVDLGAGRYVPRLDDMVDAVRELSQPGSASLAAMREALRHAARPQATAQIADLVVRLATAPPSARA